MEKQITNSHTTTCPEEYDREVRPVRKEGSVTAHSVDPKGGRVAMRGIPIITGWSKVPPSAALRGRERKSVNVRTQDFPMGTRSNGSAPTSKHIKPTGKESEETYRNRCLAPAALLFFTFSNSLTLSTLAPSALAPP